MSPDAIDSYFQLTARIPSQGAVAWLNQLARDYGDDRVSAAMARAHIRDSNPGTLLSRTRDLLRGEALQASRVAERKRITAERKEREDYEARMPAEKRAENLARLKAEMERLGLI